jgi:hypothetical protein
LLFLGFGAGEREVMKKEWLVGIVSGTFLVALFVGFAWVLILSIVMTPIQWWNGNCTVEYSKQWMAWPYRHLLVPRCKLIDDQELDDKIFENRQEIERLQREIQKLEKQKGRS